MDTLIRNYPSSHELRLQILSNLWNFEQSKRPLSETFYPCEEYFRYYTEQCRVAIQGGEDNEQHNLQTHQDIAEIVAILKGGVPLNQIYQSMRIKVPDSVIKDVEESIQNRVDLAVRLLLSTFCSVSLMNGFEDHFYPLPFKY